MADTFRALCVELLAIIPAHGTGDPNSLVIARARTALAQPEPQGPSDEQLRELRRFHQWPIGEFLLFTISRAVLARYGRPAIEPVPGVEGAND